MRLIKTQNRIQPLEVSSPTTRSDGSSSKAAALGTKRDPSVIGQGLTKFKRPSPKHRVHHPSSFSRATKLAPVTMNGIAAVWQADLGSKLFGEVHRAVTGALRLSGVEVRAAMRSQSEAGRFFLDYADGTRDTLLFTRDPKDPTRIFATLHSGDGSGDRARDRLRGLELTRPSHGVCTDERAINSILRSVQRPLDSIFCSAEGDPFDEATIRALASQGLISSTGHPEDVDELWEVPFAESGATGFLELRQGALEGTLHFAAEARPAAERWMRTTFQRDEM